MLECIKLSKVTHPQVRWWSQTTNWESSAHPYNIHLFHRAQFCNMAG